MINPKSLGSGKVPSKLTVEQVVEHILHNQINQQELLEEYGFKLGWLEKRMLTVRRRVPRVQLSQLETQAEESEAQIDQLKIHLKESQARTEALKLQIKGLKNQIKAYETDLITLEDDFRAMLDARSELMQAKFEMLEAKLEKVLLIQRSEAEQTTPAELMDILEKAFQELNKSADLIMQRYDSSSEEKGGESMSELEAEGGESMLEEGK